ncbi:UDP-glucose 4-epimerase [[Leptolyngbya] sp. PCC 7376]|uniref:NAD-dependent epimerase/dehydratase family protein n=1 Tax=[Leptolyngbya] sp. PCC 7376 TaxID=111781 RepID=UPI00029F1A21|nr:NAD-dependent epimerase/dehydratase family protein [[Leptolyngbya] sp. PCC 7376]AFY40375.1 UDP-glucose 4-epimerase [[Leptolyngbya] sp. PCC 7376]
MNILVVGGAGFIGSHLVDLLIQNECDVTVVDNLATGNLKNLPEHPRLKFIYKDILECDLKDFPDSFDGVVHLVANASISASWEKPLSAHNANLSSTIKIIEFCKKLRIPRLVYASSAAVYGESKETPINERFEVNPLSPYGLQKLSGEKYGALFAKEFGFSFVALRFFNVFGERQSPDSDYSGVISIFSNAMKSNLPITIYGDGRQTRDFIYVRDVARAIYKSLVVTLKVGSTSIINVGSGNQTSLLKLIDLLKRQFPDWQQEKIFKDPRIGDVLHSQADIAKASQELDFISKWPIDIAFETMLKTHDVGK